MPTKKAYLNISIMKNKPLLFFVFLFILSGVSCFPPNALLKGRPNHNDSQKRTKATVEKSTSPFLFIPSKKDYSGHFKVMDKSNSMPRRNSVEDIAANHAVRALLIIQHDSILLEKYFDGASTSSLEPSFSLAKSFMSALIGIAIDEGHIKGVDEKVVNYFPALANHPESETLTIEHLLNQTSGFKDKLTGDAHIYYGNINKGVNRISFDYPPGVFLDYINMNSQLLGLILQKATGKSPAQYLEEKIWREIGTDHDAFWDVDRDGQVRSFCCISATARDYARFGRLYLNQGNWNDKQIISREWMEQSIRRDTTGGSSFGYNYNWYLGPESIGDFWAEGMLKQYLYIDPAKQLIIVLLNDEEKRLQMERVNWVDVFRRISDYLE